MRRFFLLLSVVSIFTICAGTVLASGLEPVIGIGPDGSRAVKLEVGADLGAGSWSWMPFSVPIDTALHPVVTVSFDVYTDSSNGHQQLGWGWADENDRWIMRAGHEPSFGVQERYGQEWGSRFITFPFGFYKYQGYFSDTILDRYANIKMIWDFQNKKASVSYKDAGQPLDVWVVLDAPFNEDDTFPTILQGWDISLNNTYDTGLGSGPDIIWIDNLSITGSDIYNSFGFENFDLGFLNGQDGWIAGTEKGQTPPVPEPATLTLFGIGLLWLTGTCRRRK